MEHARGKIWIINALGSISDSDAKLTASLSATLFPSFSLGLPNPPMPPSMSGHPPTPGAGMPSPPSHEVEDDEDGAALPVLAVDTPIPSRADFIPNQLPGPSLEDAFVDLVELALDPSLEGVGLITRP
jgi:hypothetical protein